MVNSGNTFLVLPLENEVRTEGVSSHCLVQSLPVGPAGWHLFPCCRDSGLRRSVFAAEALLHQAPPGSEQRAPQPRASLLRQELCFLTLKMPLKTVRH